MDQILILITYFKNFGFSFLAYLLGISNPESEMIKADESPRLWLQYNYISKMLKKVHLILINDKQTMFYNCPFSAIGHCIDNNHLEY